VWKKGKEEGSYSRIVFLNTFLFDCYILKFPIGCSVMRHKDTKIRTHKQYRLNVVLKKSSNDVYVEGPTKKWWRFEFFRPDTYFHGLRPITDTMYMLSVGYRLK